MTELFSQRGLTEVFQGMARVGRQTQADGGGQGFTLDTDLGALDASRAVSCLVEPRVGDSVLYAMVGGRTSFILAVLERDIAGETTLSVNGDLRVQLSNGRFSVAAQNGVALISGRDVEVAAPELSVHAGEAKVGVDSLSYFGRLVDSVLERVFHRVTRSYRQVEERDEVRAGTIDYAARDNAALRGENTLVTAEDLVKIDAKQIIVG